MRKGGAACLSVTFCVAFVVFCAHVCVWRWRCLQGAVSWQPAARSPLRSSQQPCGPGWLALRPPPARRPTAQQISKRMLEVCAAEGLSMNQASMEALVQVGGGREHGWSEGATRVDWAGGWAGGSLQRRRRAVTSLQPPPSPAHPCPSPPAPPLHHQMGGSDLRLILGQLQMIRLRARAMSYDQARRARCACCACCVPARGALAAAAGPTRPAARSNPDPLTTRAALCTRAGQGAGPGQQQGPGDVSL